MQKLATLGPGCWFVQLGLRRGDGVAVLRWLLDLVGDPETARWMEDTRTVSTDVTPEHLRGAVSVPVTPKQTIYG